MHVVRWAAFMLALAGCLRSTSHQCSDTSECGDGVCEPSGFCSFADPGCNGGRRYGDGAGDLAGTCVGDVPGPDGGDGPDRDRDDDGVDDVFDNCPEQANAGQYDEDDDGVGDVCDNCPHIGNLSQLDIEETIGGVTPDGVGDDCDPSPRRGGDRLVFFDGFNEPPPPGTWTLAGPWAFAGGVARFTDMGASGTLSRPLQDGVDPHVIVTAVTLDSASNEMLIGGGVLVDGQPLTNVALTCIAGRSGSSNNPPSARIVELPMANERGSAQLNGVALLGTRFSVSFRGAGSQQMVRPCSVGALGATVVTNTNFALSSPGAHMGLFAHRVTASFAYVVVIADAPDD